MSQNLFQKQVFNDRGSWLPVRILMHDWNQDLRMHYYQLRIEITISISYFPTVTVTWQWTRIDAFNLGRNYTSLNSNRVEFKS